MTMPQNVAVGWTEERTVQAMPQPGPSQEPIDSALSRLDNETIRLTGAIDRLEQALERVMRPAGPQEAAPDSLAIAWTSPLVLLLGGRSDNLEAQRQRLERLLDRLET